MKALVLGATGATGRLVVSQLLKKNIECRIVVRNIEKVSLDISKSSLVEIVVGSLLEFDPPKYISIINDCDVIISCLGHNLTLKGIFGRPHFLVTDVIKNICRAIKEGNPKSRKIILMNTTGNRNRQEDEKYSVLDRIVLSIMRIVLPPQRDNEKAASYLQEHIGISDSQIEWVAVRPDTLINKENESAYEIYTSPQRSPVFNSGKTSRINVSKFMAELAEDRALWERWKGQMPVIYNKMNE